MIHRNKTKAIHDYCLECAGDTFKDVTLCHLSDCPLWEYRIGAHVSSPRYAKRVRDAIARYPEDVAEVAKACGQPVEALFFPTATMPHGSFRGRAPRTGKGAGGAKSCHIEAE